MLTGLLARPTTKTSIGKVFQDRAAQHADRIFLKFGDERLTYRQANESVNRYAAVLAAKGIGHGDVVGVMLRNSPDAVLLMLAIVKCGAVAGMLNYHQHGTVLAHSIGLLDASVLVAEPDLIDPIVDSGAPTNGLMTVEDLRQLAATAPTANPATASAVLAKDKAFYIFTSGTTGHPKASVMTHLRWLKALAGFGGLAALLWWQAGSATLAGSMLLGIAGTLAVLALIAMVGDAGERAQKNVGVCGEAAADPLLACVLVGLGVRSLSCAPAAAAAVGLAVGKVTAAQCREAAQAALAASSASAAREAARAVLG